MLKNETIKPGLDPRTAVAARKGRHVAAEVLVLVLPLWPVLPVHPEDSAGVTTLLNSIPRVQIHLV